MKYSHDADDILKMAAIMIAVLHEMTPDPYIIVVKKRVFFPESFLCESDDCLQADYRSTRKTLKLQNLLHTEISKRSETKLTRVNLLPPQMISSDSCDS